MTTCVNFFFNSTIKNIKILIKKIKNFEGLDIVIKTQGEIY